MNPWHVLTGLVAITAVTSFLLMDLSGELTTAMQFIVFLFVVSVIYLLAAVAIAASWYIPGLGQQTGDVGPYATTGTCPTTSSEAGSGGNAGGTSGDA
jgi:hypothetical protein